MGRRGRRQVLQLGDSSDSYLAKYGYNRQEEDIPGGNDESEEEPEDEVGSIAPPAEISKPKENGNGDHIDSQVANFLAQLEHEDSNDSSDRPGFAMEPEAPPSFKQNPDPKPSNTKDPEPTFVSNKARSMYKNMFVKGDSEFTGKSDTGKSMAKKETDVEWPDEPTTVWQQTLDDNTQCYYYWNTVTNEVTWEIPPGFTKYLLQMKSYEEKVTKLQKEGKVKPVKKVEPEATRPLPAHIMPPETKSPAVPVKKKEPETEVKDNKRLVDTKSSPKRALSALTAYDDSDAETSASESEGEDDKKKKSKKKDEDEDIDLDLDDIDKALEVALEKKKTGKDSNSPDKKDGKSKSEPKPAAPKKLTLIDSIKEQIKLKQETEARRKAAIEEMMARELERRVGPPRKRSGEEETVWDAKRPKIVDYGHSRSRSPVTEIGSRLDDRDSRRRHESHRERDSDRHSHKEKKKKKDKDKDKEDRHHRDEKRRDHDKHEKEHKERKKDKKKDKEDKRREKDERKEKDDRKEKDEKKERDRDRDRDKEKDKDRERKKDRHEEKEKKSSEKDSEKSDKKTSEEAEKIEIKLKEIKKEKEENSDEGKGKDEEMIKVKEEMIKVKEEVEEKPCKKSLNVDIDEELENIVTGTIKADVELANKKMQASELADLALSKLEFLEVTKKGLSKLQILLVELETRHQDWQAGGLNTEFYLIKLEEANWQLEQYERSAAPPGWSCHWDRSYRRYFYMNKRSKQTQWDYPDDEDEDEEEDVRDSSPDQEPTVNKDPVKTVTSLVESQLVTSTTPEQDEVTSTKDSVSSTEDNVEEPESIVKQRPAREWPDYEAVTNFISGTEYSGVIRGEPPPPGTDLEFLLTAPPPPPPPVEEDMEEETYSSYDVPGPPEGHLPCIDDIDGEIMEDESDFQVDAEASECGSNIDVKEQCNETETVPVDPSIIARPPQIFTDNQYPSYYDPNAISEQYQESGQYYSEGGADMPVAMETAAFGDVASSQLEKERKKKKKEKQSGGQLKNKNVSNLVQKWQKVKKEVEIEEQEREERQNAIRQKLDEWKKEHS